MKCSKCGAELRENAHFCIKCGTPVETAAAAPQPEPAPAPQTKKKTPLVPILIGCAVIVAAVAVLAYTLRTEQQDTAQQAEAVQTQTDETPQSEETTAAPQQYPYTLTCKDGGAGTWLEGVTCTFTPAGGGDSVEAATSADGTCSVTLDAGEYSVSLRKDGYFEEQRTVAVTGEAQGESVIMVAALDSTRWMVLVEWNGDRDVDLSLFNAQTNVFADALHAYDESGSFLYADHGADLHYELLSYREAEGVFTVFVKDYTAMSEGSTTSAMLSDGVTVKVYSPTEGLAYTFEGSHDQNAVVWNPLYFYNGGIEAIDSYTFDINADGNAWIWQSKN